MFFVYHVAGCCMYQDHDCGLDVYPTLEEAMAQVRFLKKQGGDGLEIELIEGEIQPQE